MFELFFRHFYPKYTLFTKIPLSIPEKSKSSEWSKGILLNFINGNLLYLSPEFKKTDFNPT